MCSTDLSSALELQEHQSSEFENSFHVHVIINRKFDKKEMIQHNVKSVIEMTQYYFLIRKINSSVVNQARVIIISQIHLARVLKYCKSDQILESCYQ